MFLVYSTTPYNIVMSENTQNRRSNIPEKIGRYEIIGEAGRGASSYVYKAYDPHLKRNLAIKVLRAELGNNDEYRNAFITEGRLSAKLIHPGIVTIFDVGVFEKKLYIVMELMEGFSFEKILKTLGKVSLHTVLEMALQLSRALHYAHEQGVIHRDIKPANIIVLIDNKTVKLMDFGIAHLNNTFGTATKATDRVTGTPEYMAPEQVMGKSMDNRSDLYSFGVLLYQLLNGEPPFVNSTLGLLFNQIINNKPDIKLIKKNIEDDKIADDLLTLIGKLLEKEPDNRYQSASEVTVKLQQINNKLIDNRLVDNNAVDSKSTSKSKSISLPIHWAAIITGVLFVTISISLAVIYYVL